MKISIQNVSKVFYPGDGREVKALSNVNLDIGEGEFVALVGPSGCGKTTLLNILVGLVKPSSGEVAMDGRLVRDVTRKVGYMSQANSLLPWRTVLENVELGLEIRGVKKKARRKLAREWIRRVGLEGFEESYPFELSGGMGKRVAIIRTLAYNPEVLFMDEPFRALDVQTRGMLEDDILRIWEETRKTIVFVTHDLAEAIALADRVVLMTARPGSIKAEYPISLPRPRSMVEVQFTPEFVEVHKRLWKDLSSEVMKARGGDGHDGQGR